MQWGAILQFAAAIPVAALGLLLSFFAAAFGLRFSLAAIDLHISAEATPPGAWTVTQLDPGNESLEQRRRLNHETHSNPHALKVLEEFLRMQASALPKVG